MYKPTKYKTSTPRARLFLTPAATDFCIEHHGTLALLKALTPEAEAWVSEHIPADALSWCGGVVVEPRYLPPIVEGITSEGLTCEPCKEELWDREKLKPEGIDDAFFA